MSFGFVSDNWTITWLKPFKTAIYTLQGQQWGMDATANMGTVGYCTTHANGNILGASGQNVTYIVMGN